MILLVADRCAALLALIVALTAAVPCAAQAVPSAEELAHAAERKRASLVDRVDRLSKEIDASRLSDRDLAEVLRLRGIAYSHLTQNEQAAADLSRAIELDGFNPQYYEDRAITYLKLREFAKAQTDLAMALGLDRKGPTSYREEGRLGSYQGDHTRAARGYALAMENDDGMGALYAAIWLHIAITRGALNVPSPLARYAAALPPTQWPEPVIQMLIGTIQPDQAIALADASDADTYQTQKCEAYFYAGEHFLAQQRPRRRKPLSKRPWPPGRQITWSTTGLCASWS